MLIQEVQVEFLLEELRDQLPKVMYFVPIGSLPGYQSNNLHSPITKDQFGDPWHFLHRWF